MIYNDKIASSYGGSTGKVYAPPLSEKPMPKTADYTGGIFTRTFVYKINERTLMEISAEQSSKINTSLYRVVSVKWTITGQKDTRKINGIVEIGVKESNKFEINRVLVEEGIDISMAVPNLLEYWRGH